jgi:hypothetical protein
VLLAAAAEVAGAPLHVLRHARVEVAREGGGPRRGVDDEEAGDDDGDEGDAAMGGGGAPARAPGGRRLAGGRARWLTPGLQAGAPVCLYTAYAIRLERTATGPDRWCGLLCSTFRESLQSSSRTNLS